MKKAKLNRVSLWMACLLTCCIATGFSLSSWAESISVARQGDQSVKTPRHGMKMDEVLASFGEPLQKLPAVGDPPITRWIYSDFTVYFEYELVIHSVVHPQREKQN